MIKMKLQTKLAFAFLGSAFLALMIWDRGSKTRIEEMAEEDQEDFEEPTFDWGLDKTKHYFESERILTRSKRATIQVARTLNTVYNQLSVASDCCNVPKLLATGALNYCNKKFNVGQNRAKNVAPVTRSSNWFDFIRSGFLAPNRRASRVNRIRTGGINNQKVRVLNRNNQRGQRVQQTIRRGKRQAFNGEKVTLMSVCFNDCLFNYLNYMNRSAMNLPYIEETMTRNFADSSPWFQTVLNAMYTCEEPAACANPEIIEVDARYCSIKPTILLNCMRKQMTLECPDQFRKSTRACNVQMTNLRSLNVMKLG